MNWEIFCKKPVTAKAWSQGDLVRATNLPEDDIQRIESYQLTPDDSVVLKLAKALDLDGPTLIEISKERWTPEEPSLDPDFDLVCLNVFMGEYPVNCYLLRCKATGDTAVVDTGANPENDHQQGQRDGRSS